MSEDRKKILEMLSQGKISVDEAEKLLAALSQSDGAANGQTRGRPIPKYLRVLVEPGRAVKPVNGLISGYPLD